MVDINIYSTMYNIYSVVHNRNIIEGAINQNAEGFYPSPQKMLKFVYSGTFRVKWFVFKSY